jgi:hypothetical protein
MLSAFSPPRDDRRQKMMRFGSQNGTKMAQKTLTDEATNEVQKTNVFGSSKLSQNGAKEGPKSAPGGCKSEPWGALGALGPLLGPKTKGPRESKNDPKRTPHAPKMVPEWSKTGPQMVHTTRNACKHVKNGEKRESSDLFSLNLVLFFSHSKRMQTRKKPPEKTRESSDLFYLNWVLFF